MSSSGDKIDRTLLATEQNLANYSLLFGAPEAVTVLHFLLFQTKSAEPWPESITQLICIKMTSCARISNKQMHVQEVLRSILHMRRQCVPGSLFPPPARKEAWGRG